MNINNLKYFNFIPIFIGTIALIMSYQTIVNNTLALGWIAYCMPIVVDCLLIFCSIQSFILRTQGNKLSSQVAKLLAYIAMLGTLYLNNIHSVQNNQINYVSLIAHSFVVIAYIICAEFLLVQAKHIHIKQSKLDKKEDEILQAKHDLELAKIKNEAEYERNRLNVKTSKLDDTGFLLKTEPKSSIDHQENSNDDKVKIRSKRNVKSNNSVDLMSDINTMFAKIIKK